MHPVRRIDLVAIASAATTALLVVVRPRLWPVPADGNDLACAVAWAVACACSVRLTVTSLWCAHALHRSRPEHARRVARYAPLFVRRAVEVAVVSSITLSVPVAASAQVRDEPVVRTPAAAPAAAAPRTPPAPRPVAAAPRTYVVRRGDSLWSIAQAQLVARGRPHPTEAQVARYWRALVAANRTTLRSGNPSLIYPGEVVALPPGEPLS